MEPNKTQIKTVFQHTEQQTTRIHPAKSPVDTTYPTSTWA